MLFFFFIVNPLILVTKADFTVLYLNICPTGPKVISADEHPLHPIERVFDEKKDWLFDQSDYGQFIIDRGCSSAVNSVEIINAENNLRSSKKVRVSVSNSLSDNSWIEVLVQELPDKRDCVKRSDCDTLERFYFSFSTKIVRYVKLQVLEVYGVGGGLTKFDIYFGNSLLKGFCLTNCQARVRSPKVQSPKVKTKRTWADTKITWATHHPTTTPPITFKHEGVLW